MPTPRVRFCPAPSGWLHVGGARTALYNWLHARGGGGAFVFRIEDTDADRATQESMDLMIDAMRWLGLEWDEGPGTTGRYGPYRQSERTPLYAAVANELLRRGLAYDAYETPEELEPSASAPRPKGARRVTRARTATSPTSSATPSSPRGASRSSACAPPTRA
jgi:glutamyl-tRNA synthetase